ncbi:MAG: hypothetical protein D6730_13550 [Bacteroidetes bacterium]|nr:MAG: hypothetical protein D6730_13550 [Bacteroidota bacterium]
MRVLQARRRRRQRDYHRGLAVCPSIVGGPARCIGQTSFFGYFFLKKSNNIAVANKQQATPARLGYQKARYAAPRRPLGAAAAQERNKLASIPCKENSRRKPGEPP